MKAVDVIFLLLHRNLYCMENSNVIELHLSVSVKLGRMLFYVLNFGECYSMFLFSCNQEMFQTIVKKSYIMVSTYIMFIHSFFIVQIRV